MFKGFTQETIDFMYELRYNNNKEWFEAHKDAYKRVLETPMRELAEEVFDRFTFSHGDLEIKLHIARIYRDARRPNVTGPYKDHLWFTFRPNREEWTEKPVFMFEAAPQAWWYGMGYYKAKPLTMRKLRARIDTDPDPLEKLDRALARQSEFVLEESNYARPKRDGSLPLARWYNKNNLCLIHADKKTEPLFSRDLVRRLVEGYEFLLPYYEYFMSLEDEPDPA
ncbi:MAG: DUF2461 domain-containing protein [Eubacteriales bacterium]|nr:DUF2461 domain-containing protein [Eubacteriales bacterium]